MNTNKKLALNKQLVANLDSQNMAEVKGGGIFSLQAWCIELGKTITQTIILSWQHCFSGDDQKGICNTDLCSIGCGGTDNTNGYASCYGGSCGKCG